MGALAQLVKLLPAGPYPVRVPGVESHLYFRSSSVLMRLGGQQRVTQVLGFLPPVADVAVVPGSWL